MTAEQFEKAKELDILTRRIKGWIVDLDAVTSTLRVFEHDCGCKTATMRIVIQNNYQEVPPVSLINIIHFLEEQKEKYEKKIEELNKEFSEV